MPSDADAWRLFDLMLTMFWVRVFYFAGAFIFFLAKFLMEAGCCALLSYSPAFTMLLL